MKTHTTLDLDRGLLEQAAEVLGTSRSTDTVHAALRDVIARARRAQLVQRDFSNLGELLPEMRAVSVRWTPLRIAPRHSLGTPESEVQR